LPGYKLQKEYNSKDIYSASVNSFSFCKPGKNGAFNIPCFPVIDSLIKSVFANPYKYAAKYSLVNMAIWHMNYRTLN